MSDMGHIITRGRTYLVVHGVDILLHRVCAQRLRGIVGPLLDRGEALRHDGGLYGRTQTNKEADEKTPKQKMDEEFPIPRLRQSSSTYTNRNICYICAEQDPARRSQAGR